MQIVYSHCAGIDVHKKSLVVCCRIMQPDGTQTRHIRTFSTMTAELLALLDWLFSLGITHVAMERTGEFWKPVYNLLEPGNLEHDYRCLIGRSGAVRAVEILTA